jgi:hypothetical protein
LAGKEKNVPVFDGSELVVAVKGYPVWRVRIPLIVHPAAICLARPVEFFAKGNPYTRLVTQRWRGSSGFLPLSKWVHR